MLNSQILVLYTAVFLFSCSSIPVEVQKSKWINKDKINTLVKLWSVHIGQKSDKSTGFTLKPIIYKDSIYVIDYTGLVRSIDSNGLNIWQQKLETGSYIGIDVKNDLVLISSKQGKITLLKSSDGGKMWDKKLQSNILSSAKIADGQIIIQLQNEQLLALDSKTSKVLWRYYSGNIPRISLHGTATPYIENNIIYTGFANGSLVALDNTKGELQWQQNIFKQQNNNKATNISDIDTSFSVSENYIFSYTHKADLTALNKHTGEVAWSTNINCKHNPVVDKDKIYVIDTNNKIYALDKNTGKILWLQATLSETSLSALEVLLHYVAVGDEHGNLYLISQLNGKFAFHIGLKNSITGTAIQAAKDKLYLIDDDANLHAVELK